MGVNLEEVEGILAVADAIRNKCKEELLKEGFPELQLREKEIEFKERELAYQVENKARELDHAERMLALQAGLPLPDAYSTRIRAIGAIGTMVPMAVAAAAAAASVALLQERPAVVSGIRSTESFVGILTLIWGICAGTILGTVWFSLQALRWMKGTDDSGKDCPTSESTDRLAGPAIK